MSEQTPQEPQQPTGQYGSGQPPGQYPPGQPPGEYPPGQPPGQYGKEDEGCPPQPTPPPVCPDPCDQDCRWGPPEITPECCPDDRECCPEDKHSCTWDEVEDPCVRASSAGCGFTSTKLSCKCESSNTACTCEEWECGFPDGMCVPCKPCEDLIPDPTNPDTGGCDDPKGQDCNSDELRLQLEANKKCINAKQAEKAKIEADIKARQERDKELSSLISGFNPIIEKYKAEHHKLVCREDCLKGFYRDMSSVFEDSKRFPLECKEGLRTAINKELCAIEKAKCCQKNLEWKLEKVTRLIWKQKEAEKAWKKAEEAFSQIKDLPKWMSDQFAVLETLKDQIAQAINDKDPQKHKWAFYLFYWKFVPALCKRFKVAICCEKKEGAGPAAANYVPVHIGCTPGDWHPSKIKDDTLRKLICCAWDYVKKEKARFQEATAEIDTAKQNLEFIKKKVEDDAKTLEDRIKSRIEKVVECTAASSR